MSDLSGGIIGRLRDLIEQGSECEGADWSILKREIDDAVVYIEQIESRIKRRDETIRELRRTVVLELLSLQTKDSSDSNRTAIQKNTIDRLRQDEQLLVKWRQKANMLEEELRRIQTLNSSLRINVEVEKSSYRNRIDELEFNNRELMEHVKTVNADIKYVKIVMIGKDAIIEKQYGQLQDLSTQNEALHAQNVALEGEKAKCTALSETLYKKIEELQLNNQHNHLLERIDLMKNENITLKKSLADYKAGYHSLTERCRSLTDSLATKDNRKESKGMISPMSPKNNAGENDEPSVSSSILPNKDDSRPAPSMTTGTGKRRKSSRLSILRKKSLAVNALTPKTNTMSTESTMPTILADGENDENKDSTRIHLRRLRADSTLPFDTKHTEEKSCQANIDSSQYANVRMGNEEEVVVKALYRRVAELEDAVQERQSRIDDMQLELNDKALQVKRKNAVPSTALSGTTDADQLTEYQTQSFEEFLAAKAEEKGQRKQVDELLLKINAQEEHYSNIIAKQVPEPKIMESKATHCETQNFVTDSSVQAVSEAKNCSTQTAKHTPISNHQTIEDPFYSYIFKELLDVCKHVVKTNQITGVECEQKFKKRLDVFEGDMQDSMDSGGHTTKNVISGCKNLISSLHVLQKDLLKEMKYRGGDFDTLRSRSFLRCIEVVIRGFDKIINYDPESEAKAMIAEKKLEVEDEIPVEDKRDVNMMMTPMTLRMTQFESDNVPIYEYDYKMNNVLFSCIETPTVLPESDHFGGGVPRGVLVKPSNINSPQIKQNMIKHCETNEMDLLADSNWVIPRVSDSFCDSFMENVDVNSPQCPGPGVRASSSSSPRRTKPAAIDRSGEGDNAMSVNISPVKLRPHTCTPRQRVVHHKLYDNAEYVEEFFAISRPLSAQNGKSKQSPRHTVFVERK